MRTIIAVCAMGFILSACDKGQEPAGQPAGSMEEAPAPQMKASYDNVTVDHTKDEMEFNLKRSLWGVESMLEDYKQKGLDTAELEQQKAELEKELSTLM